MKTDWIFLAFLVWAPAAAGAQDLPSVLVLGFENHVEDDAWQDRRLGMGMRGQAARMFADSGAFRLLEDRELAPSVREAVDGRWLSETETPDADALRAKTGADWIADGALLEVGVTRDRVTGIVSGRRWAYRVKVRLCLHGPETRELCREGEGRSVTRVRGVGVEYRGDEVAFDQAGPAQAVQRALVTAFNTLMPIWDASR